ncbi:MAG: saccharopine dehydrogenase NADP-binding domain-containing protein, partial [Hyphomicrobiaceae bacterium]
MKVLVLGGYGVFGGRLAELLSDVATVEIVICGRSLARAEAFCSEYRGLAVVRPLQLSRDDIEQGLRAERPDLVVDASGPFQAYGEKKYNVIKACITSGIDYLDFADAADFVFGVSRFDAEAKVAGVSVLSGVSSFPVLTAAVLRHMAQTMDVVAVEGGIAPSPYAGIGLNVMRAVVGYAGAPVKLLRNGVQTEATGLAESMRFTIAVPGRLPLKNIHFSLVDVPDLQVIPPEHPCLRDIWMGAGPVPEILHRILNVLAKARAAFALPSFGPLSGLFYKVLNLAKFGEHRGGMFVRARGFKDGMDVEQSWHLLAEGDDGPYIPSMAIEALIRKCLAGERPDAGARAATGALELVDYERLFQHRKIYTGFRVEQSANDPLYRQVLGTAFEKLPPQVRSLHDSTETRRWTGQAQVQRGEGVVARLIGWIIGFPDASPEVPV